jgi:GNAT superfamily N-acetyltransferase
VQSLKPIKISRELAMELKIRAISENELEEFSSILKEAALWLKNNDQEMWSVSQLSIESLLKNNSVKEMFIGFLNNEPAATMIIQEEDTLFWSDENKNDSLFLHKIAVRRKYAKFGLSQEMIHWAKVRAKSLNKSYVRLDCAADRPKLCKFYESQGFRNVGEKVMFGKYPTAFYQLKLFK